MFSLFDWLGLDEALLVSNLISAIVILMGSSYVDLHYLIAQTLTPGNNLTLGDNVFVNRVTVRVFLFLRLLNFLQLVNLCRKLFLRLLVALI